MTIIARKWISPRQICEIQAFVDHIVVLMCLMTMGFAALNRYVQIAKIHYYNMIFTTCRSKLILGSIWALLLSYIFIARGIGWQQFTFIPGYTTCAVSHKTSKRSLVHYSVILLFFFVFFFCLFFFRYVPLLPRI